VIQAFKFLLGDGFSFAFVIEILAGCPADGIGRTKADDNGRGTADGLPINRNQFGELTDAQFGQILHTESGSQGRDKVGQGFFIPRDPVLSGQMMQHFCLNHRDSAQSDQREGVCAAGSSSVPEDIVTKRGKAALFGTGMFFSGTQQGNDG
jgi:hypothetical protein